MRVTGSVLIVIISVTVLVASTLASSDNPQTYSVFIKIMLNHAQMITIATTFKIKWPPFVKSFLTAATQFAELTRALVAFDCWMDTRSRDPTFVKSLEFEMKPMPGELRITYIKLIMWVSMPVFACLSSYVCWTIIMWYRDEKNKQELYTRFLSTLIVMLFLVHPMITQYFIDMFNCTEYDGETRLNYDLQIICWEDLH